MKTTGIKFLEASPYAFLLLMVFLLAVSECSGQTRTRKHNYYGFRTTLGTQILTLHSDIDKLSELPVLHEGGSIGGIWGTEAVSVSIDAAGFFYSASRVPHTVELVRSAASISFFPLAVMSEKSHAFHPFASAGFSLDRTKFYGHYISQIADARTNYGMDEPYLGKVTTLAATAGLGLAYRLREYHFWHLFVEAVYQEPLERRATRWFGGTYVSPSLLFQIGMAFGSKYTAGR